MTTALYRHFDTEGKLLYVGISQNPLERLQSHKAKAEWYSRIASVTVENFQTRELAEKAEVEAIEKEGPVYNLQHVPKPPRPVDKRSLNLEDSVSALVEEWENQNPGTKFGWMVNRALENYLAGCAFKRTAQ